MKKRVKSLLVVLCMLITMIPTTFMADEVTGKITCVDQTGEVVEGADITIRLWNFSPEEDVSVEIANSVNGVVEFDVEMNDTNDKFIYNNKEYEEIEVSYVLPDGCEDLSGETEDAYWQYADIWFEEPVYELNVIDVQKDEETPMTCETYICAVISEKGEFVPGADIQVFLCNAMGDEADRTVIANGSNGQLAYDIEYKNNRFWYEGEVYAYIGYSYTLPEGFQCEDGSMGGECFSEPCGIGDTEWYVEDLSDGVNGSEEDDEFPYTTETVVSNEDYTIEKGFYDGELISTTIDFEESYSEEKVLEALTYVSKEDNVRVYLQCDAETFPVFTSKVLTELASIEVYVQIYNEKTEKQIMFKPTSTQEDFYVEYARSENTVLTKKLQEAGVTEGYLQYVVSGKGKQGYVTFADEVTAGIFTISDENVANYMMEDKYIYYYDEARDLFVSNDEFGHAAFFEGNEWEPTLTISICKWGNYVVADKPLPNTLTNATIGTEINTDKVVEKDVLEDAKENGESVNVQVEASEKSSFVNWMFEKIETVVDFIPTVQVDAVIEEIDKKVDELKSEAGVKYTTVSFDFDGVLPGKAEVTLDIKKSNLGKEDIKEGQDVYLYYFNPEKKDFELVDSSVIRSGFATFSMTHCSDYIITTEELPVVAEETTPTPDTNTVPKTGDNTMVFGYALFMLVGMCLILTGVSAKKNVR